MLAIRGRSLIDNPGSRAMIICGVGTNAMKSKVLGAAFAAGFLFAANSASAVTFDVNGANIFGATLTGTIEGDATLTTVSAVDLLVSNIANPFTVLQNYAAPVLSASNIDSSFITVWLTFAGGPPTNSLADIQTSYNADTQNVLALFDPATCNGDLPCEAFVSAQRAAAIAQTDAIYATEFAATAVSETPVPAALPHFRSSPSASARLA